MACQPAAEPYLRAEVRFVERLHPQLAMGELPRTTISAESRNVLSSPEHGVVESPRLVRLPADRRVRLAPELDVRGIGESLIVRPAVRRGKRWKRLAPFLAPVLREGPAAHLDVVIHVPGPMGEVEVSMEAWAVPDGPRVIHESPEIEIPEGAFLSFALAILEVAWRQGAVRFEVSLCEGQHCEPIHSESVDPALAGSSGWLERRVDLADQAGRRVRFRFETVRLSEGEGAFSLPVWGDPTLWAPGEARARRHGLILISFDTLGARHLPTYGYPRATAPFLDRLARRGVVFERCTASANTTAPSHMTAFTSLQPTAHGVFGALFSTLPSGVLTLAERLRREGFAVAAYTEDGPLAAHRGFARGFNPYFEKKSGGVARSGIAGDARGTFERGARWLLENREHRPFLFLHTFEVHTPYRPGDGYASYFTEALPELAHQRGMPPKYSAAQHDREIRYLDDEFRRFFERLDAAGVFEDTLLVVMADHGEAFLEHGYAFHGGGLHDEVLHVPLILYGPGIPAGRRVEEPVSLIDLAPTLLDLLGQEPSPGAMGRSLRPLLDGPSGGSWSDRPLFAESWIQRRAISGSDGREMVHVETSVPMLAVRMGERKLILEGGVETALYDLVRDPFEQRNLLPGDAAAGAELRKLLEGYLPRMRERRAELRGPQPRPEPPLALDPEREEKLRALGYLD